MGSLNADFGDVKCYRHPKGFVVRNPVIVIERPRKSIMLDRSFAHACALKTKKSSTPGPVSSFVFLSNLRRVCDGCLPKCS